MRLRRRLAALALGTLLAAGAAVTTAAPPAQAAPTFQVPFPCGQQWSGQTRTNHSPQRSIDFNRPDDLGDPVVASAAGTVSVVRNLGNTSYGRYVVVDHGGGWTSYYAHLNSQSVSVGQRVSLGQRLGTVGSTGGSTGPHLHYEQRQNGSAVSMRFNGTTALYWGTRTYTSQNSCGGGGGSTATGTVRTSQGGPLTVRSSASTSARAVGTVANGSRVTIQCQTTGSSVTGFYGTSTIWNRIGSGRFISDAYTYTGSNGFVAPRC
jgi:murein DD-endopeptidase MepM/ murein hydrolase activator NlpD